jgi:uncharacterized protein (TIGR02646 family)
MIHIDVREIPLAEVQHLIDAAAIAQDEINKEADPKARRDLIEAHRSKWVAFRTAFEKLSNYKCWYTESKNPGTDDDVDHFRPKGRIAEDKEHGGYYWKALDWKNFRLSCHRANRLRVNPTTKTAHGKSDHFPLFDPSQRARTPDGSLAAEQPLLLDPCDPFDPPKLTFNTDGTVAVSPAFENNPYAVKQVETSRVDLHLDWPRFVDDRTKLYNQISFKVQEGEQHADLLEKGDAGSGLALKSIVTELLGFTKADKPYSAAAVAYIYIYRSIWWVRDVVLKIPFC